MRRMDLNFSVENLLVIIAIVMILIATFAPQLAKSHGQLNSPYAAHTVPTTRSR